MKTNYNNLIENWSYNIAQYMQGDRDNNKAIVAYGLEVFILNALIGLITVIASILLGIFTTTFSALIASGSLRVFTGGYHSSSPVRCMFLTVIMINLYGFLANRLGSLLTLYQLTGILFFIMLLSYIIINKNAPVDTPNKPIKAERKPMLKKFGLRVWGFWACTVFSVILFKAENLSHVALAIGLGIASQTLSISGVMQNKEV
ncbi:hypothetical protein N752_03925 [Desulforamulus aquiferis]|nr:accessory gene regulator B family protein [Desulforamulus aquiferis]RYD06484.1 hypothetical protein N752_03925 [Desulforamulus aquiferis]